MSQNIHQRIEAMRDMTAKQLRETYIEVFGEPSRSGNKAYLFKRIAWRLQSNVEGTLSERARRRAAELARDADIRTTVPRHPAIGSSSTRRTVAGPVGNGLPMPGAIITREYKGRTIEVKVLPKGFEYLGEEYGSLTAVAKAVTGSHWSGNRFFGLTSKNDHAQKDDKK